PPGQAIRQVLADIEPLMQAYSTTAADLPDATRQDLITRHGWIGKVAMTTGQAFDSPEREALLGGGGQLVALLMIAGVLILVGGIVGLVLFIIGLVKVAGGRIGRRLARPAPGGSVYLETLAIFFIAFVGVKLVVGVVAGAAGLNDEQAQNFALGTQWILVLVPFWPILRGVSFEQLRADIGWTAGEGVFKEIGAGIVGYLAGIPIFLFFVVLSLILTAVRAAMRAQGGDTPDMGPIENPVFDLASSKGIGLVLLFTLATIWAPIVEEAVFRGSLYRHLRSWLWIPVAALGSALVFGLVHGYDWVMLGPVIGLGLNFALMREWRGSLIAPMTAHCMHNAMSLTFVITMLRIMGD
ncbi:MAG: CPBP family intramembrane glutamic endopeptidase, partial [Planctomycetota bacterium]